MVYLISIIIYIRLKSRADTSIADDHTIRICLQIQIVTVLIPVKRISISAPVRWRCKLWFPKQLFYLCDLHATVYCFSSYCDQSAFYICCSTYSHRHCRNKRHDQKQHCHNKTSRFLSQIFHFALLLLPNIRYCEAF